MAAPPGDVGASTSLSSSLVDNLYETAIPHAPAVVTAAEETEDTWLSWLGHVLLVMARAIPGLLVWLITFSTITLPAFLFTLASTSLTVTMNATTVYELALPNRLTRVSANARVAWPSYLASSP